MGSKNRAHFVKMTTIFWGAGILILLLGYFAELGIISILVAFIFPGPIYGIKYFIDMPSDISLILLSTLLTYAMSLIGYWIGKMKRVECNN